MLYNVNGINTSFSEMMGLPTEVLTTEYWLPWYNNVTLDTQLRLANTSTITSTQVSVYIGGAFQNSFNLAASESIRQSFTGINNGPVRIVSNATDIVVSERVLYKVNGVDTSFSEMTALPKEQLSNEYWLPWYNNVTLDTQLRVANVSGAPASVHVFIGGDEMVGSPFNLTASGANQSKRISFTGINAGPVQIVSNVDVVASERVLYKVNGVDTSFSEEMALPKEELSDEYWMPWYNNIVQLDTQLRVANTSTTTATDVDVYIGGNLVDSFTLAASESTRESYVVNNGPVRIVSDTTDIIASERVLYNVNSVFTSFSEMIGLPAERLSTEYWAPWYNNVTLDTQIRFGRP